MRALLTAIKLFSKLAKLFSDTEFIVAIKRKL